VTDKSELQELTKKVAENAASLKMAIAEIDQEEEELKTAMDKFVTKIQQAMGNLDANNALDGKPFTLLETIHAPSSGPMDDPAGGEDCGDMELKLFVIDSGNGTGSEWHFEFKGKIFG
jgi:DNA anti-recombination protein RmuC